MPGATGRTARAAGRVLSHLLGHSGFLHALQQCLALGQREPEYFLRKSAREVGKPVERIAPEAMALLAAHPWPGNVRELEHAIERAVILTQNSTLLAQDIPPELQAPRGGRPPKVLPLREVERRHLLFALERAHGNRKRAVEWLGVSRRTLYRMAARHGINLAGPDD